MSPRAQAIEPEGRWVFRGPALWGIFGVIVAATVWATSAWVELRQFRTDTEKRLGAVEASMTTVQTRVGRLDTNVQMIGSKLGVPVVLSQPSRSTDMTDRLAVNDERVTH